MAEEDSKKVVDVWAQCVNPLYGLTQRDIECMLETARMGNDATLQIAYELIEQTMPIFGICIDKRVSQLTDLSWHVEGTAAEQVETALRECDAKQAFDSVQNAIEHLALYSFRGRSCVKPFWDADGLRLKTLNNWNVLLKNNRLYWNPEALMSPGADFQEIPESEVLFCTTKRPIDLPGILIYLRQNVGETKWAQFVERQGIPQVLLTAPEGTPETALAQWTWRAQQIFNGGSGVLPPGAKVDELTAARGQDPFSEFCRHQMEMVAILATGGSLNTIGGSTGLGSNLAEVQNDQFMKLVRRDIRILEKAMTKLCQWTARKIGVDGSDVVFKFDSDDDQTKEVLETAERMKALGASIDVEKVKALIRYDVVKDGQAEAWTPVSE